MYCLIRFFLLSSLLSVLLAGCSKKESSQAVVLAEVGELKITAEDLNYWMERQSRRGDTFEQRKGLVEELVTRSALAQKAIDAGVDQSPEFIAGLESLLIAHLKERQLQPQMAAIAVDDDALWVAYEAQKEERFLVKPRYDVAVLWLNSRKQPALEERFESRLRELREKILEAEVPLEDGFGSFSIGNTEHRVSRFKGGKLGWLEDVRRADVFKNAVVEIARGLGKGALSDVVVRDEGVFLVRLLDKTDGSYRSFEEVKQALAVELKNESRAQLQAEFNASALERTKVVYHLENLKKWNTPVLLREASVAYLIHK